MGLHHSCHRSPRWWREPGFGYTYADKSTAILIQSSFAPAIIGRNAMDGQRIWADLIGMVRNIGRRGVAAMAISAVDAALWDLRAKILDLSAGDASRSGAGKRPGVWKRRIHFLFDCPVAATAGRLDRGPDSSG